MPGDRNGAEHAAFLAGQRPHSSLGYLMPAAYAAN